MEIARAERDEAARWLAIYDAQTAGRTAGDQHSSHSGIPSEMSEVLARALAAQPGNSTVQRIVGLALVGQANADQKASLDQKASVAQEASVGHEASVGGGGAGQCECRAETDDEDDEDEENEDDEDDEDWRGVEGGEDAWRGLEKHELRVAELLQHIARAGGG